MTTTTLQEKIPSTDELIALLKSKGFMGAMAFLYSKIKEDRDETFDAISVSDVLIADGEMAITLVSADGWMDCRATLTAISDVAAFTTYTVTLDGETPNGHFNQQVSGIVDNYERAAVLLRQFYIRTWF